VSGNESPARRLYLVTIKTAKDPTHNPRAKKTGACMANAGGLCTDVTGEHHTLLIWSEHDIEVVQRYARRVFPHVTRIEETFGFTITPTEEDLT
jgi:hypothetical protein